MFSCRCQREQPHQVPTDEVIPARFFDDTPMVRGVVMRWMARFNDVLDAKKLHLALVKLLETGSWKRLGGRLRLNKQGKLEIHVPQTFDSQRPAVRFLHLSFDTNISEHPLATRLPQPTEGPSIQEGGNAFRGLGILDKLPETLEHYLHSDEPPLALHVVSFRDATVVSINFPHALTDAMGFSALVRNWCMVLAGREGEVAPLARDDPMERLCCAGEQREEVKEHILQAKKLVGFGFFLFAARFVLDLLFGPKMETRMIFLPGEYVTALKQRAMDDLPQEENQTGAVSCKPFISEGDILTAWGTKMVAFSLGPRCARTLTVMNVFELRSRLKSAFTSSVAYVQNAFFVLSTSFTPSDSRTMPLGRMALRLRSSLDEQTTEPQIQALIRQQKASLKSVGRPVIFAEPNSMILVFSNWSKASFFDVVDFSPAAVRGGKRKSYEERTSVVGKPVFFNSFDANPEPNPTHRNVFNILGKDSKGNYWITGMLSRSTWSTIEEDLNSAQRLVAA